MYVGVTKDIERRLADHADGRGGIFTRKYRLNTLVRKIPRCARDDSLFGVGVVLQD
jgi:predicted GIY-YIG superfamily endonuclease